MKVILAEEYGFCNGVKRALARLDEAITAHPNTRILSIGEIIHNNDVVRRYRDRGVVTVDSVWEVGDGIGVVRAHGLPDSTIDEARGRGLKIIDATCPFVRLIARTIQRELDSDARIYLVGEPGHPEVVAATKDFGDRVTVLDHAAFDAENFDFGDGEAVLLSQTTMAEEAFLKIVGIFISRVPKVTVYNTICQSTRVRQSSAVDVARRVDAMVVLGGKRSSNARRLAELCGAIVPTQFIERIADLDLAALGRAVAVGKAAAIGEISAVGITAGASTPDDIVAEAAAFLEKLALPSDQGDGR